MKSGRAIKNLKFSHLILSIIWGLLLSLSFPPFNLSYLSWIAFLPFFSVINNTSKREAFLYSYLGGAVFFLITLSWLTKVTILGWIVLCLYLSLYPAIFGFVACFLLASRAKNKINLSLIFVLPTLWVTLEYLRAHFLTGFGWNSLGYSQFKDLALIQIADFSGVYGVSAFIIFFNYTLWEILRKTRARWQERLKKTICLLLILTLALATVVGYAVFRLQSSFSDCDKVLRISVIQPNISQELKWAPDAKDYIIKRLIDSSKKAVRASPDIIIWPESAMPLYFTGNQSDYEMIFRLARDSNIYLLTGVVRNDEDKFYNSAILISPRGEVITTYDKLHLVPYGEFIPFREITPFLASIVGIGDFNPGRFYTTFSLKTINFAVLICFEDAFGNLARESVRRGASLLVNITNDAWFDAQAEPQQHLAQSVFRAIENRTSVVRCANTGISGLINAKGQIERIVSDEAGNQTFIAGFETFNLAAKKADYQTFYTRNGDIFVFICIAFFFLAVTRRPRRRK